MIAETAITAKLITLTRQKDNALNVNFYKLFLSLGFFLGLSERLS